MITTPRSPRLLLLSTIVLAVAGLALLDVPHVPEPPAQAAATAHATTDSSSAAALPPSIKPTASTAAATATPASTPSAVESAPPPHGEGAAGDQAIQRNLQTAWPADLPTADERELLTAGRALQIGRAHV